MFFAIAALVVSAVEIAVGVWIGLSVAKYRRSHLAGALRVLDSLPASPALFAEDRQRASSQPRALRSVPGQQVASAIAEPRESTASVPTAATEPAAIRARKPAPMEAEAKPTEPTEPPPGDERRMSFRRPFTFRQHIAPYHGGSLPGKASFRVVECQDISSTGFSFLSTQLPDFDSLVVALGAPPRLTYLQAHIVNRFPVNDGSMPLYRIGCRFAGPVMP